MAQRLVRAKRKISDRRDPVPRPAGAPAARPRSRRCSRSLYLIFNEGYDGRAELADEAIRLGASLAEMMPDEPEVQAPARADAADRVAPRRAAARRRARAARRPGSRAVGRRRIEAGLDGARPRRARCRRSAPAGGPTSLQAEIAALHCGASDATGSRSPPATSELAALTGSPVVALNRAVAIAESEGPEAGLAAIEGLDLDGYHYLHCHPRRAAATAGPRRGGARGLRSARSSWCAPSPSGGSWSGGSGELAAEAASRRALRRRRRACAGARRRRSR